MDVLTEQQLSERVNFARPLNPPPDEGESIWCIPFEYGECPKGTRISISKAREIAADLRAAVAEAEKRELLRAFKQEQVRGVATSTRLTEEVNQLMCRIADLEFALRRKKKRSRR